jgi:tetrathionate reductase subunit B
MKISRREAFQLLRSPAFSARTVEPKKPTKTAAAPRWVMVVDLRRCIGCQACTVACGQENNTPVGHFRTQASIYEITVDGQPHRAALPRLCNHCASPPCVQVCPTQATFQRGDGAVLVDNTVCIGCGYCVQTCPYEARFINPVTHTADKCTFCFHRVEAGLLPACVETCVGGARVFGDLNNPSSTVAQLVNAGGLRVLKPAAGTQPSVFYLGIPEALKERVNGTPLYPFELEQYEEFNHG